MRALRQFLLKRLWSVLSILLGLMQLAIIGWWVVVVAERPLPAPVVQVGLAIGLPILNLQMIPVIARARQRGGGWRRLGRLYMSLAGVTILLGSGVLAAWALLLPASHLAALAGSGDAWGFFRLSSMLAVGGIAAVLAWGFSAGQLKVDRTSRVVELPGLAPDHHGLRIVQISDLHIGNGLEGARLERMVERVNALDPDVLAITGDIFDYDPAWLEHGARILGGLRARHGVFAVLGNHDHYVGREAVAEALREHAPAIRLLREDVARLSTRSAFYIAGVDDPGTDWAGRDIHIEALERLGGKLPDDGPVVLLVHRPEAFAQAERLGFPLVLAGHTHGGQIALPLAGRHINLARFISSFDRGFYRRGRSRLYVNRGLGVAGPAIRLNCTREIATIVLAGAEVPGDEALGGIE
jgi:predicted MPP superfamily phosphohydrolase